MALGDLFVFTNDGLRCEANAVAAPLFETETRSSSVPATSVAVLLMLGQAFAGLWVRMIARRDQ